MLRSLIGNALRTVSCIAYGTSMRYSIGTPLQKALYSSLQTYVTKPAALRLYSPVAISTSILQTPSSTQRLLLPTRNLTKFSLNKGKRKSVRAVIKRFRRLDWGCWIRTHSGRQKKLFKKSPALKRRLRQHVFTNSTQSWMLDKMVGKFWRRPKNWVDDPYAPYNRRDEFFATKSKSFKV